MGKYKYNYITSKIQVNISGKRKTINNKWMSDYETKEASFRHNNVSYEQLGIKLSKHTKDNGMGEYETNMETSFWQNNIS